MPEYRIRRGEMGKFLDAYYYMKKQETGSYVGLDDWMAVNITPENSVQVAPEPT